MVRSCMSGTLMRLKDKARSRVGELQGVFADLYRARKESRDGDVVGLEERVHRMLSEWKAELSEASPASSLLVNDLMSPDLSSEIQRMLQLYEEEDDASSKLAEPPLPPNPKPEPGDELNFNVQGTGDTEIGEIASCQFFPESEVLACDGYKTPGLAGLQNNMLNSDEIAAHLNYQLISLHQGPFLDFDMSTQIELDVLPPMSELIQAICPPPSAFLRPKCALWDCPRPAWGSEWYLDYCSSFHATLAFNEGPPGMAPVLRPGGIDLKDGPLFAALSAKTQGKNVGIPECQGAATAKSPWNAPELFDIIVLKGESLREWLFFDKPRRAFESGNRKQRSLPDYCGRGWHESRKQVMKEFGGLKRSYYMDPQPPSQYEWHLYEYEISDCDSCALYRLELKLVDAKRSKSKVCNDLVDLQQKMGRLNAESTVDKKWHANRRNKMIHKEVADDFLASWNENIVIYEPHGCPAETLNQFCGNG
ncbi:hypothetical protein HPP92_027379 [Vanilla planifolia]|uniref:Transcription factor VOZ1 n=1 Tax=Vanilla planifolia TaxID=51239 RepID=A0A835PF53_VANPL|nr:hypothetical protein HPP92_027379 [Vanilla planifolia]KAG0449349.1 hypothetical protein HPP92_027389 [Vanilla planifolia]